MNKFAIIGTGFIMPRHAEAIDFIKGKILEIINTSEGVNNWKKIIKNTKADYIIILTPNDLHSPISLAALKRGKTVLCEKPLCLNTKDVKILAEYKNIFTVVQLRHHLLTKKLKKEINSRKFYQIEMDIAVHRDPKYYKCWKGQEKRSGGILFNLGIHYFDILIHLFGEPEEILNSKYNKKEASGILKGKNYVCRWRLTTDEPHKTQRRVFKINGVGYNFSSQDNLSHENLHRFIYQDLIHKKGTTPQEALKSIGLIENIYYQANKKKYSKNKDRVKRTK